MAGSDASPAGAGSPAPWADEGRLPCLKTRGGHRRFLGTDVERLLAEMSARSGHALSRAEERMRRFVAAMRMNAICLPSGESAGAVSVSTLGSMYQSRFAAKS